MNQHKIDFISNVVAMDLETTGVDPSVSEIIEMATVGIEEHGSLFRAEGGIPHEVSAVTNLIDEDVVNCPIFSKDSAKDFIEILDTQFVVCHNISFEKKMLEAYDITIPNGLCTLRMARKLYKDVDGIDAFNLPYLRYALDLSVNRDVRPHRALPDSDVTFRLLLRMIDDMEKQGLLTARDPYFEQIEEWLNEPIWIDKMPFGKHKDKKLEDVPMTYWDWALDNMGSLDEEHPDYDSDFAASVFRMLEAKL